jgi:hypothetical protein
MGSSKAQFEEVEITSLIAQPIKPVSLRAKEASDKLQRLCRKWDNQSEIMAGHSFAH